MAEGKKCKEKIKGKNSGRGCVIQKSVFCPPILNENSLINSSLVPLRVLYRDKLMYICRLNRFLRKLFCFLLFNLSRSQI